MAAPNQYDTPSYQAAMEEAAYEYWSNLIGDEEEEHLRDFINCVRQYQKGMINIVRQIRTQVADPALASRIIDERISDASTLFQSAVDEFKNKTPSESHDAIAGSSENPTQSADTSPRLSLLNPVPTHPVPSVLPPDNSRCIRFSEVRNRAWMYLGKDGDYYATLCLRVRAPGGVRHWFRTNPFRLGAAAAHFYGDPHPCHEPVPQISGVTVEGLDAWNQLMRGLEWRVVMDEGMVLTAEAVEASNRMAAGKHNGPGWADDA